MNEVLTKKFGVTSVKATGVILALRGEFETDVPYTLKDVLLLEYTELLLTVIIDTFDKIVGLSIKLVSMNMVGTLSV